MTPLCLVNLAVGIGIGYLLARAGRRWKEHCRNQQLENAIIEMRKEGIL